MVVIQTERSLQFVFSILSRPPKTSDETCRLTIPDTLLYLHGSLRVWFNTDHDSGEVMRRDRREWSVQAIMDAFCAGLPENSPLPVATYLHYSSSSSPASSSPTSSTASSSVASQSNVKRKTPDSKGNTTAAGHSAPSHQIKKDSRWVAEEYCRNFSEDAEPLCVDYFDRETLAAFLATRDNKHNVVVQRFVRGTSQNFTTLQMVWSPHRVVTMQRQNIHKLGDDHVALYDRCNTHENTAHLSREVCTTAKMSTRIEAECRKIVDHIAAVENRHVVRMVAFFAFNTQSVPVLLWASEVQITEQPITKEELAKQLTFQTKRRLCFISPPVVSSDVILKGAGGGGGGGAGGSSEAHGASMSRTINVVDATASTHVRAAIMKKGKLSLEDQLELLDQTFTSAQETRPSRGHLSVSTRLELAKEFAGLKHQTSKQQSQLVNRRDQDRAEKYRQKYVPGPFTSEELAASSKVSRRRASSSMDNEEHPDDRSVDTSSIRPSSALSFLQGKEIAFCRGGGGGFFLRNVTEGGVDGDAARGSLNGIDGMSMRRASGISLEQQLEDLQASASMSLGRRRSSLGAEGSFFMSRRNSSSVANVLAIPAVDWSAVIPKAIAYREGKSSGKLFALMKEAYRKKTSGSPQLVEATDREESPNNAGEDGAEESDKDEEEEGEPTDVYFNTIRRNVNDEEVSTRPVGKPVPALSIRNGVSMYCLWELFSHKIYHNYLLPTLRSHYNALDFLEDFVVELESAFYEQAAARGGLSSGPAGAATLRHSIVLELLPIVPSSDAEDGQQMTLSVSQDKSFLSACGGDGSTFDRLLVGTRSAPIVSLCFLESILKVLLPHEKLPSTCGSLDDGASGAVGKQGVSMPIASVPAGGTPLTNNRRRQSTATFDIGTMEVSVLGSPYSATSASNTSSSKANNNSNIQQHPSANGALSHGLFGSARAPSAMTIAAQLPEDAIYYPPSSLASMMPPREVRLPLPSFLSSLLNASSSKRNPVLHATPRSLPHERVFEAQVPQSEKTAAIAQIDEREVELVGVDRDRLRKLIAGIRCTMNAIESSAAFLRLEVLSHLYNSLRESYTAQMNRICSGGKRFRGSIPTATMKPLQLPQTLLQRVSSRGAGGSSSSRNALVDTSFTFVIDVVRTELDAAYQEAQKLVDWPPATVFRPIPLCIEALVPQ